MTPVDLVSSLTRKSALNLRDRLILSDPGLIKFRSAVRGTLLVSVGFLSLLEFTRYAGLPLSIAFLGTIITMMGALTVNEASRRDQMITLALLPIAGGSAAAISLLVSRWHWLSLAIYLAITFSAVYIRRIGPRGIALGTGVYMSYFCSLFFKLPQENLIYVVLAILGPGLLHFVIRLWIVPETPLSIFRWTLHSYRAALTEFLRTLANDLEKKFAEDRNLNLLRRHTSFLNELALNLHDSLSPDKVGQNFSAAQLRALQGEIFELELAAQRVASAVVFLFHRGVTHDELGPFLAPRLRAASHLADSEISTFRIDQATGSFQLEKAAHDAIIELDSALIELVRLKARMTPLTGEGSGNDVVLPAVTAPKAVPRLPGLPLTTKQAIQATVATFFAIIFGTMLSTERWYWAPMTAYVLFAGATRGENLNRALHRVVGTVVGLIIGLGIAAVFNGHHRVQLVMIFVGIFCGIYTARSAYIWTTIWFSVMVAVFFGLLGQMTPDLFWLRVEETLIGAVCGAAAAAFLFPVSTSESVRKALSKLLEAEAELFALLADGSLLRLQRKDRLNQVRKIERDLAALRLSISPFMGKLTATRSSDLESAYFDSAALVYYSRHLAIFLREDELPPRELETVKQACAGFSEKCSYGAQAFAKSEPATPAASSQITQTSWISVQNSLSRIQQLLDRITSYPAAK